MPLMRAKTLLLDTNVWIDYFMGEGGSLEAIKRLMAAGAVGELTLLYAPTSAKDMFYLIPRRLRRRDDVPGDVSFAPAAWACVSRMMELACAAPLSAAECELARKLGTRFGDFEDGLVLASAETAQADFIVTNDRAFLAAVPEACITPERAVELAGL